MGTCESQFGVYFAYLLGGCGAGQLAGAFGFPKYAPTMQAAPSVPRGYGRVVVFYPPSLGAFATVELAIDGYWPVPIAKETFDIRSRKLSGQNAELGSTFLCADLELTPEALDDHTSYIASWIKG